MCSLSSYKQRERRECGYSRRFYRLNVYTTNLYPPTGNLDSNSSRVVIKSLAHINKEMKKTILLVTHDPKVASYCKKIILLKDGQIMDVLKKDGEQKEFYQRILRNMGRI